MFKNTSTTYNMIFCHKFHILLYGLIPAHTRHEQTTKKKEKKSKIVKKTFSCCFVFFKKEDENIATFS